MRRLIASVRRRLTARPSVAAEPQERALEIGRAGLSRISSALPWARTCRAGSEQLVAAVGLVHDVARDEHRRAAGGQVAEVLQNWTRSAGSTPDRRLVEEQDGGRWTSAQASDSRRRIPPDSSIRGAVPAIGEVDELERPAQAPPRRGRRTAPRRTGCSPTTDSSA